MKKSLSALEPPVALHLVENKTLVHADDLPFLPSDCPDVYTSFRKVVEGLGDGMVRPCLDETNAHSDESLKPVPVEAFQSDTRDVYTRPSDERLEDIMKYMMEPFRGALTTHENGALPFTGGETAALQRLQHYVSKSSSGNPAPVSTYKQTRNGLVGADFSTKFSPYLAFGCLSPRLISQKIDEYDRDHTAKGLGTKDTLVSLSF